MPKRNDDKPKLWIDIQLLSFKIKNTARKRNKRTLLQKRETSFL